MDERALTERLITYDTSNVDGLRAVAEQRDVRVRFVCVPDEESEDIERRTSDDLVRRGLVGDFAITGEPTNLHVGIQAKGVLACRLIVHGRAAHGSTPWLGDNAVLKAIDVFRRIESLPFSRESSELFDRPSVNLGRIHGGDALNKVPDLCQMSVGRDGASDAVSFLEAGIPAVEFGPAGAGHHGPEEWVSISSLARYRQALCDFVAQLPAALEPTEVLRAVEGGLA